MFAQLVDYVIRRGNIGGSGIVKSGRIEMKVVPFKSWKFVDHSGLVFTLIALLYQKIATVWFLPAGHFSSKRLLACQT